MFDYFYDVQTYGWGDFDFSLCHADDDEKTYSSHDRERSLAHVKPTCRSVQSPLVGV